MEQDQSAGHSGYCFYGEEDRLACGETCPLAETASTTRVITVHCQLRTGWRPRSSASCPIAASVCPCRHRFARQHPPAQNRVLGRYGNFPLAPPAAGSLQDREARSRPFVLLLINGEGVGADREGNIQVIALCLKEQLNDKSSAHSLEGSDVAEDFLALSAHGGELIINRALPFECQSKSVRWSGHSAIDF